MSGIRKFSKIAMNLDAWTVAYVGGMATKPSSAHIQLIDKFVKTTKSILSNKADVFYFGNINNSNDSYRNLVKNAHHGTIQGSDLVWDNLVGFTNPNGTGYVNTNYNPATQGVNYLLNNAGIGVNVTSSLNYSQDGQYYIGCQSSINNKIQLHKSSGNNGFYAYINSTLNYGLTGLPFSQGFFSANRTATNSCNSKNQNIVNSTSTVVSSAIPSHNIYIYGNNNAGTFDKPYTGGLNCVYIGASLTDAEYVTLNTAINEYLIGCLFLKYENDNWGVRMAKSYFYDLHGFEKYEAWEVYEFIKRHQPDYNPYPQPELCYNSGIVNTTDWVDTTGDGLANGMSNGSNVCTNAIVTGNGFTGNAQQVTENNAENIANLILTGTTLIAGTQYLIIGKYRSSTVLHVKHSVDGLMKELPINSGNAISFGFLYTPTVDGGINFITGVATANAWFAVDEVSAQAVISIGSELSTNSGADSLTDWVDSNADGLADGLSKFHGIASIVTGNGFTGNAQKLLADSNINTFITKETIWFSPNKYYSINFKHRNNNGIGLFIYDGTTIAQLNILSNLGNCISYSLILKALTTTTSGIIRFYLRTTAGNAQANDWLEIDEVSIKEITTSGIELCTNTGNASTTDWVDSPDGLANGWTLPNTSLPCIYSIVTGNGFIGNAQRCIENNTGNVCWIMIPVAFTIGKTYVITGKYRSSNTFALYRVSGSVVNGATISANTANATQFAFTYTSDYTGLYFRSGNAVEGDWFEIDEVSIKEVSTSDITTFNKCLNSGFGLATDFVDTDGDGLADGWELLFSNIATSIVTGNGFVKKAQRLERLISSGNIICVPYQLPLTIGKSYTIYCKYRSNIGITLYPSTGGGYNTLPINTENAIYGSFTFVATDLGYRIGASSQNVGSWFEISEVLIIDNSNSQFYYNVFGPNGLNIPIANHIMLFKAGGDLIANAWTKSGALLRWNQGAGITNSNTMPAYTRGSNLGIVTVTSTDGWNDLVVMLMSQTVNSVNSFYGNFPLVSKIKMSGKYYFNGVQNRFKYISTILDKNIIGGIVLYSITYPGFNKNNIAHYIGGSYSNFYLNKYYSPATEIIGDMSGFTNEVNGTQFYVRGYDVYNRINIYGTLNNYIPPNGVYVVNMDSSNLTGGLTTHNKNIGIISFGECKFSAAAVEDQLRVIDTYFTPTITPIKNLTVNLSGISMGIASSLAITYRNSIIAKHTAAGFTCTITLRLS